MAAPPAIPEGTFYRRALSSFFCHGASWALLALWAVQSDLLFGHYSGNLGWLYGAAVLALLGLVNGARCIPNAPPRRGVILLTTLALILFAAPAIFLAVCMALLATGQL